MKIGVVLQLYWSFIEPQVFDDPLKMNNIPISCFKVLVGAIFLMELEKAKVTYNTNVHSTILDLE
jgi:hypothetical protein